MTSLRLQIWDLRELWQWIINECVCQPPRRGDPDDQLVSQLHFRRQTWVYLLPAPVRYYKLDLMNHCLLRSP